MELTRSQQQAIRSTAHNLQLIACAGSGKTEVVARRVAHLLTRRRRRLRPANIVAFTFTNKASAELKERILLRTEETLGRALVGAAEMYVGTIHGFCQELLKSEVPKYLKHEPLDAARQKLYVDRNSRKTGLTECTATNGRRLRRYVDTDRYTAALSALREDEVVIRSLRECSVAKVGLPQYRERMDEDGYLDFSALLDLAVRELDTNTGLRNRLAQRIKCVIVDEYQDVNPVQERLIRHLHDLGAGVCVVGDDDQTIYQWRGSAVENIVTFQGRYPNVRQIRLQENFRSSPGVINTAREFVETIGGRLDKAMSSGGSQRYEAGDIVALSFDNPVEEARYIVDTLQALHGTRFEDRGEARGLAWSDMAVLLRSVRNNGPVIAEALRRARIPFVVGGIANLFEAAEAEAARLLFHYISGRSIGSGERRREPPTKRVVREAWKAGGLGTQPRKLTDALHHADEIRDRIDREDLQVPSIQAVFLNFLELIRLREEDVAGSRGETALFNLGRFSEVITDWETIHFADQTWSSFHGFAAFLYFDGDDTYSEGSQDTAYITPDAVQITTVHQAKGREWPVVFLPALLRNRFPSPARQSGIWQLVPRAAFGNPDRYDGSEDDERRLFYVGMTRSMKFLHMTWAPVAGKRWYQRKSVFWEEVLSSRYVKRRRQDYGKRRRMVPRPRASVADVEFSFSDLKYMFECPYQFKLRVLYGFNAPIQRPMGYGKSLHDALAEVHYRAMEGTPVGVGDVPELVERHLRTPYAFGKLKDDLKKAAHRDIKNYIEDNADRFSQIEFWEQNVEVNLGEGIRIKGRIDLVRRTDTQEVTIVDLKSNEGSQEEQVTEHQLHTYALGYEELTGRDADYVEIYELREGKGMPRPVDEDFMEDVRTRTLKAAKALRTLRLKPTPSLRKCQACDLSSLCEASMA